MSKPQFAQHLPPQPWMYVTTALEGKHDGTGRVWLADANGNKIAELSGSPDQKLAVAEMILDTADIKIPVPA